MSSHESKQEAAALRTYNRVMAEANEAFQTKDMRLYADKLLEATMVAPSKNDERRYGCFSAYVGALCNPELCVEMTEEDKVALKQISADDESEPVVFRATAMHTRGLVLRNSIERREDFATFHRRTLKILGDSSSSSQRNCRYKLLSNQHGTDTTVSAGEVMDSLTRTCKDTLEGMPDFVYERTVESIPDIHLQLGQSILKRLAYGGSECDCCGKPQGYEPEDELFMRCSRCKKAYYCSRSCQEKDWNAGHKDACRGPGEIQAGDYMLMCGPGTSDYHGKLVRVKGPGDYPGICDVVLLGSRSTNRFIFIPEEIFIFTRATQLAHIRPVPASRA